MGGRKPGILELPMIAEMDRALKGIAPEKQRELADDACREDVYMREFGFLVLSYNSMVEVMYMLAKKRKYL